MKALVTPQGIIIPIELLPNVTEVEIRQEQGRIVIIPLKEHDPIFMLGQNPVDLPISDASVKHDIFK